MFEKILEYDKKILLYLNNAGSDSYDFFWMYATEIITWIPLFILFLFLVLKNYKKKKEAWIIIGFIVGALLFNLLFTEVVKENIERIRPNNDVNIKSLLRIIKEPTNYSFFSGHASSSFAITVLIFLFLRKKIKLIYLFFLWPLLFSYSRIYVGVHYPSDILIGAMVGISLGIIFYKLYNYLLPRFKLGTTNL